MPREYTQKHSTSTLFSRQKTYIYAVPVRLWHWSMALAIAVLTVTGYSIGKPWHSLTGDPSVLFYMGYTRMAHFIAGYVLIIGLIARLFYTFWGNSYTKEIFILPVWKKAWWQDLWCDIRWYLFLEKEPALHMGHNPLAQVGMFFFMIFLFFTCITGFTLYAQESIGWYLAPFRHVLNLVYTWGGNGIDLHNAHRLGMKCILAFVLVHLYMVIREEIMGKTTLVSTMFSGYRHIRKADK